MNNSSIDVLEILVLFVKAIEVYYIHQYTEIKVIKIVEKDSPSPEWPYSPLE
jgi:hypothetical protein